MFHTPPNYPPDICAEGTITWVDTTSPEITITLPKDGAEYILNQEILADYAIQDAVGVDPTLTTATVPVGSAIPTETMGEHTFTVLVEDYGGNTATKSVKYTVLHPPIANAGSDQNTFERVSITFDGSGSTDPDDDIVSYAWNFGNGMSGTGVNPSHTYTLAGEKIVTLTVTDDDGLTGTDIAIIIVKTPT